MNIYSLHSKDNYLVELISTVCVFANESQLARRSLSGSSVVRTDRVGSTVYPSWDLEVQTTPVRGDKRYGGSEIKNTHLGYLDDKKEQYVHELLLKIYIVFSFFSFQSLP